MLFFLCMLWSGLGRILWKDGFFTQLSIYWWNFVEWWIFKLRGEVVMSRQLFLGNLVLLVDVVEECHSINWNQRKFTKATKTSSLPLSSGSNYCLTMLWLSLSSQFFSSLPPPEVTIVRWCSHYPSLSFLLPPSEYPLSSQFVSLPLSSGSNYCPTMLRLSSNDALIIAQLSWPYLLVFFIYLTSLRNHLALTSSI